MGSTLNILDLAVPSEDEAIGAAPASCDLVGSRSPLLEDLPLFAPPRPSSSTALIVAPEVALTRIPSANRIAVAKAPIAPVLSPSQVRTFLDCQARWWFKYGLGLPESKTSSLALGLAIHRALEVNFREKLETHEDLDTVWRGDGLPRRLDGTGRPDPIRRGRKSAGPSPVG